MNNHVLNRFWPETPNKLLICVHNFLEKLLNNFYLKLYWDILASIFDKEILQLCILSLTFDIHQSAKTISSFSVCSTKTNKSISFLSSFLEQFRLDRFSPDFVTVKLCFAIKHVEKKSFQMKTNLLFCVWHSCVDFTIVFCSKHGFSYHD